MIFGLNNNHFCSCVAFFVRYKSSRFRRAVAQAERYLSQNEVPDEMIPLYNDELLDDIEEVGKSV